MFVSKRAFQAAQDEIARLRTQLGIAQKAEADYQTRARDLTDAMIAARADAREVRLRAEQEAAGHLSRARQEAIALTEAAQVQVATARAEVERLEGLQRNLGASVERSLAALRSALANTGTPRPADSAHQPAPDVSYEDALPRFRSEVTTTQPVHVSLNVPIARPHLAGTAQPLPVQTTKQLSWRSEPRGLEALRMALLRPGPIAGVVAVVVVVVVALFSGVWFSRQTRRPLPKETLAASTSATPPAGPVHLAPASGTKSGRATPPAAAAARELAPVGVGVTLRAIRAVWVRVDVDGRRAVGRVVRAGEQFTYRAEREVAVRAGDAGALLISVNGLQPAALGGDGVVLTKRLTSHPGRALDMTAPSPPAKGPPNGALPSVLARLPPVLARPRDDRTGPVAVSQVRPVEPQSQMLPRPPDRVKAPTQGSDQAARADAGTPTAPPDAPALSGDETDVLHAHEAYFHALGRGDASGIARLTGDGFTVTGSPAADESGVPFAISLSNASVEVRGVGAVVSGTGSQRITGPDGQARQQPLLFSEIWIKRGDQWQLTSVRFLRSEAAR
jgi:hypothetical protein